MSFRSQHFHLATRDSYEDAKAKLRNWRENGYDLCLRLDLEPDSNLLLEPDNDIPAPDPWCGLFEELAQCQLSELRINFDGSMVFGSIIAPVIVNSRNTLKVLSFRNMACAGGLPEFVASLREMPLLHKFLIYHCFSTMEGQSMEDVISAVSTCPNLNDVNVWQIHPPGSHTEITSANGLADLCRSTSLRYLVAHPWGRMNGRGLIAMFRAIQANANTKLKVVHVLCKIDTPDPEITEAICEAVKVNKTIQFLYLKLHDTMLLPLARALKQNRALKKFTVHKAEPYASPESEELVAVFAEMIKENYVLESISFHGFRTTIINDTIRFYLKLNEECRRKHLLEGGEVVTRQDWIDVIMTQHQDTSVVYYLLSKNPTLCLGTPDFSETTPTCQRTTESSNPSTSSERPTKRQKTA